MRLLILSLLSIMVLSYSIVSAQEFAEKPANGTRIEVSADKNDIRFYIDGELGAVLTEDGFHVLKGIFYGGQVADYGKEGFDKLTRKIDEATGVPNQLP